MTPDTVFAQSSYYATSLLVVGKAKTYYFAPGSVATYSAPYVMIRSYNALWIFNKKNIVQMRRMSDPTDTYIAPSSLDPEMDSNVVSQLGTMQPDVMTADTTCADCAFPADKDYLTGSTIATPPPAPDVVSTCGSDGSQGNCNFPNNPEPDGSYAEYGATAPQQTIAAIEAPAPSPHGGPVRAMSCVPNSYTFDEAVDACVLSTPAIAASMRPHDVGGVHVWAYKYLFAGVTLQTGLYFNVPYPYYFLVVGYQYGYSNILGQWWPLTTGAKQFIPPKYWRLVFWPTGTWASSAFLNFYAIKPTGKWPEVSANVGYNAGVVATLPNK
jgi:hypothetical protein